MTTTKRVKPCPTEHEEQCDLVAWIRSQYLNGQCLGDYFLAIPNGAALMHRRNRGARYSPQALKLKAEGLSKGFPDLFLAVPTKDHHGLMIELKRAKKSLSKVRPEQKEWIERLNSQGYKAVVAYGAQQAKDEINRYLNGDI